MSEVEAGRVARRVVFEGRVIHVSVDEVRLPDGRIVDQELVEHPGAAAVLPVLGRPDDPDPHVLLIRQYRYAAGGYLYEVPAGKPSEAGEPWQEVARRELEEETGWKAGRLIPLTRIFVSPGFTDEVIHLWLATDLEPGTSKLDEDELVEVIQIPLSQAVSWVADGRIIDGKSVAAILYAARFVLGSGIGAL